MRRKFWSAVALTLSLAFSQLSGAADVSFDNENATNKWEDAINWQGNNLPVNADRTRISSSTFFPATAIIDSATETALTTINVGTLHVSDDATHAGTLNMSAAQLNISAPTAAFTVGGNGNAGGSGTFNMSGGTVTLSSGSMMVGFGNSTANAGITSGITNMSAGQIAFTGSGQLLTLGQFGNGTFNMTGGTLNWSSAGTINVGGTNTGGAGTFIMNGANAVVNLNGGTLGTEGTAAVTAYTRLTAGTLNTGTIIGGNTATVANIIIDGASVNVTNNFLLTRLAALTTVSMSSGSMNVGSTIDFLNNTNGQGTFLLSGGTINSTSININRAGTAANNGFGYMSISQASSSIPTYLNNTGTITVVSGSGTGGTGTLVMTGGTLKAGAINAANNSASGSGTFLVSGGTIITPRINLNAAGTSYIRFGGSAEILVGTLSFNGNTPDFAMTGGTLTVGNMALAGLTPFGAGTLSPGNVTVAGGGASYGQTTVRGSNSAQSFTLSNGGSLHMDVGQTSADHDLLSVAQSFTGASTTVGSATFATGSFIDVDFRGDTNSPPSIGTTWDLVTIALGNVASTLVDHSTLRVANTPGWTWEKLIVGDGVSTPLTLQLKLDAVPEPSMLGVFGITALTLLKRRNRHSSDSARSTIIAA